MIIKCMFLFYSSCKFDSIPSWIGIAPDNWLPLSHLMLRWKLNWGKKKKKRLKRIKWILIYRSCKLDKFPSSVGIVPENWFEVRPLLLFLNFNFVIKTRMIEWNLIK